MIIKNRLWIEHNNNILLGQGRINLLLAIEKHGSINKASQELNMSYKKAWRLIDQINERAASPIVMKNTGGINGGGTTITSYGKELIITYQNIIRKCDDFLKEETKKLNIKNNNGHND